MVHEVVIDIDDKLTMTPSLESGANIFNIRNLHTTNPMIRFRVGEGGGETIVVEMRNEGDNISRDLAIGAAYELRTNRINTNGDNAVVFQRNSSTEFTIHDTYILFNGVRVDNLHIKQFASGVQYADIRLQNADSTMRILEGDSTSQNIQTTNNEILMRRETRFTGVVKTNFLDAYTDTDLILRRNGEEYSRLDNLD